MCFLWKTHLPKPPTQDSNHGPHCQGQQEPGTQVKDTPDPPAAQPQESRGAGDQETTLITRTGASVKTII